ncbi:Phytanoyl- dioxygenase [Lasiodiplodia theobromae]|uniref:Phytanoyl- dioxygenase n=1 Tax=Lasiodiplodia theobromae TaxID=45133 RepID=UPI0015C36691|nr:Phytanoyl- dioxygenase [Lasiodiplodia theobromae]KAF4540680.1 Phytanoyl- dioxygenase [Lasiodiplodia theobromae]
MPHYIDTTAKTGDWRDALYEDGFVVVKGVLSQEKASSYVDRMFQWLESFPFGFKRDDPSTWNANHLPAHMKGGMFHGYAVQHEKVMWDARCEPNIIEAFSKLWGTDKLLVSFDGMNLTIPATDRPALEPWPHVDQSPLRKGMQCVQGILNFAPNGPKDGGLIVVKGSSKLEELFFEAHNDVQGRETWGPADWFGFQQDEVDWFLDRGCEVLKVCADPGDLILWDSRTVHWNVMPESDVTRAAMYICYTPASFASAEDLELKSALFKQRCGTTHWPHANIFPNKEKQLRLGKPDTFSRERPYQEPEENELTLKLAGVLQYED